MCFQFASSSFRSGILFNFEAEIWIIEFRSLPRNCTEYHFRILNSHSHQQIKLRNISIFSSSILCFHWKTENRTKFKVCLSFDNPHNNINQMVTDKIITMRNTKAHSAIHLRWAQFVAKSVCWYTFKVYLFSLGYWHRDYIYHSATFKPSLFPYFKIQTPRNWLQMNNSSVWVGPSS